MLHSVAFQGSNIPTDLIPRALPWADLLMALWAESQRRQIQFENPYSPLFQTFPERHKFRELGHTDIRT